MDKKKDSDRLVVLATFPTEADAMPLVEALNQNGIKADMTGGFTAGFIAEAPGDVQVNVFESQLDAAQKILSTMKKEVVDWSSVDVGDPE